MHELSFHRAGALLIPRPPRLGAVHTHPLKHKDRQNLTPKGCLSSCPHLSSFKTQYHVPNQPHHSPGHQHKMASQSQASVQFVVFRDHLTAYNSVSRDGFVSSHTVRYHRISLMRGLARAYIATADCAPYHENCTRMAELTTMLSWTINACEIGPDRVGGMLQDTIQTSHQYHGLHTRLLNTCRRLRHHA